MNNLEIKFNSAIANLTEKYITSRKVPAMESIDVYPVLLINDGDLPINAMHDGNGYIMTVYVADANGEYTVESKQYRSVNVRLSIHEVDKLCDRYNTNLSQLNYAILRQLELGASEIANLYVKRYINGQEYSYINDPNRTYTKESKLEKDLITHYSLYPSQPLNITARMLSDMRVNLITSEPQVTPRITFGRNLNGEL